jgi:hypothetical protein
MKLVKVTFTMDPDDESHPTGLTNETFERLSNAVISDFGGDDLNAELVEKEDPQYKSGGPKKHPDPIGLEDVITEDDR